MTYILIFIKKALELFNLSHFFRNIIFYFIKDRLYKTNNIVSTNKPTFLIVSYGGLGDIIMLVDFALKLSNSFNVYFLINEPFYTIHKLLNSKKCLLIPYTKQNLFQKLKLFRNSKYKDLILIQHTPIVEFFFIRKFLKFPPTIGTLCEYFLLESSGLDKKISEPLPKNRPHFYKIFKKIIEKTFLSNQSINLEKINNFYEKKSKVLIKEEYIIVSPTKDNRWKAGKFGITFYQNLIIRLFNITNKKIIMVGTARDLPYLEKILRNIPSKINVENLAGKTNLYDVSVLTKNCLFVVANDNGIHHLSNFLNKKTLTLFNFSSPFVFSWNKSTSHYLFNNLYKCMPCVSVPKGPWDNTPFSCPFNYKCSKSINEENVIDKLIDLKWIKKI